MFFFVRGRQPSSYVAMILRRWHVFWLFVTTTTTCSPQHGRVYVFFAFFRVMPTPVSLAARTVHVAHTVAATATTVHPCARHFFALSLRRCHSSTASRYCRHFSLSLPHPPPLFALPLSVHPRACHNAGMGDAASELIDDLQAQSAVRRMVGGSGGSGGGTDGRGGVTNNKGFTNGDDW